MPKSTCTCPTCWPHVGALLSLRMLWPARCRRVRPGTCGPGAVKPDLLRSRLLSRQSRQGRQTPGTTPTKGGEHTLASWAERSGEAALPPASPHTLSEGGWELSGARAWQGRGEEETPAWVCWEMRLLDWKERTEKHGILTASPGGVCTDLCDVGCRDSGFQNLLSQDFGQETAVS